MYIKLTLYSKKNWTVYAVSRDSRILPGFKIYIYNSYCKLDFL